MAFFNLYISTFDHVLSIDGPRLILYVCEGGGEGGGT
jgi:hypothetical protein